MKLIIDFDDFDDLEGGKIAIKDLKELLHETYKRKGTNTDIINNKYKLDDTLSTDKTKVYINTDDNEVVIANRGTSDIKDVITDMKLLFGYKDNRFDEGRNVLNKVKEKYNNSSIDTIGHSLGASVAENIGNDPQVKNIITLNKPTTPIDIFKRSKIKDKQYDIKTTKDLISVLSPIQKDINDIIIPSETNNPYTEHKVDVLNRLNQDLIVGKGINKIRLNNADIKRLIRYILKHKKIKNKYSNYDIELLKNLLL
jgi:hypothetical protein